jgi:hypothetical protein
MTLHTPENATPTAPALSGALQAASARALSRRDRTVVAVLATDGFPTTCWGLGVDTADEAVAEVASIAAEGVADDPAIPTFVIGVFTPEEEAGARAVLDAVAEAGGSERAFLVNTAGDVTSGFREALEAIRESTPGCDYSIPEPEGDAELDYTQVNVQFTQTPGEDPETLYYVADPEACADNAGGWYYDVALDSDEAPARIIICAETCELFRDAPSGAVSISIGCESIAPPPR